MLNILLKLRFKLNKFKLYWECVIIYIIIFVIFSFSNNCLLFSFLSLIFNIIFKISLNNSMWLLSNSILINGIKGLNPPKLQILSLK